MARCPIAGPGLCGGCDFQHVASRPSGLKTAVVADQLRRLAGIEWTGRWSRSSTPETADGLQWRTRMRYVTDGGRRGSGHRSHRVVPLPAGGCRIPAPDALTGDEGTVTEIAAGRRWAVAADGFWQVHPAAADTWSGGAGRLRPEAGSALSTSTRVGLFAGALADAGCQVGRWRAAAPRRSRRQNLADVADRVTAADRVSALARLPQRVDLVVDLPRTGPVEGDGGGRGPPPTGVGTWPATPRRWPGLATAAGSAPRR